MSPQVGEDRVMLKPSQRLGKEICQLVLCRYKTELNEALHEFMSNKMAIYFNVFSPLVKHRIFGDVYGSHVVTFDRDRCDVGKA